jgi:hypothetical protein
LLKCEFKQLPITRRIVDYDLDDPTERARQKLIELCHHLIESIDTRFENVPEIFMLMKNCLDVSRLHQQVLLINKQIINDYGVIELKKLIDYTALSSNTLILNESNIQNQYLVWKQRCLDGIDDHETLNIWTTAGKISTPKVMKSFYMNASLYVGIHDFLHFYLLMVLKIRSEAVCESAASVLKENIHNNRALHHDNLDNEVLVHWNAPPLHLSDSFIEQSLNGYFMNKKDKNWLFYKKTEQYRPWRILRPGSVVFNRLRNERVPRLPELVDD